MTANTSAASNMKTLGDRVRFVQVKVGGWIELEKLTGASSSQQSKLVRNEIKSPGVVLLNAIAKAGGVSLDWLATGEDDHFEHMDYLTIQYIEHCNELMPIKFNKKYITDVLRADPENVALFRCTESDGGTVLIDRLKQDGIGTYLVKIKGTYLLLKRKLELIDSYYVLSYVQHGEEKPVPVVDDGNLEIIGRVIWSASQCS